jgi:cysteine desulfurase / selenocysteine lyase
MDIDATATDLVPIDEQAGNCQPEKELTTHGDPSRDVIPGADEARSLRQFRTDFPAFEECIYMNLAGRGLLSRTTRNALDAGFDDQMMGRVDKSRWKAAADDARQLFGFLVNARPTEIACTKNVSDGLNAIATALPWKPGDNVVYCPDFDHPNAAYAWLNLGRMGVERRPVPLLADGRIDIAGVARATDSRTRLVAVSSVNFVTGIRAELGELGQQCRRAGIFFLVDGAQSTGVLEVDVEAACIDGWCAAANKGLLGPYGVGFAYCREEVARQLRPVYLSRFGVDAGDLSESEMASPPHELHAGARRFEVGNANWTGLIAVAASMRQLREFAQPTVERRAVDLASKLAAGLRDAGFEVPRLDRSDLQSHIVAVYGGVHDRAGLERLDQQLCATRVAFSRRLGAIRFGLHAYNTETDVDHVVDLATRPH